MGILIRQSKGMLTFKMCYVKLLYQEKMKSKKAEVTWWRKPGGVEENQAGRRGQRSDVKEEEQLPKQLPLQF